MLVRDRMTSAVVTVEPKTPIFDALALMKQKRIRRLPVMKGRRLVGIVTWTDLMRASPSPATSLAAWEIPYLLMKAPVAEVMTREPLTIAPTATIEEAAVLHWSGLVPHVARHVCAGEGVLDKEVRSMNTLDLGIVVLVVLGAVVLLPALMMSMWDGWGMMGPGMMGPGMMSRWGDGTGFGFGPLVLLLFIGGVGLIVLAFARKEPRGEEPLQLLKRRLATGEITMEQFDELRQALQ